MTLNRDILNIYWWFTEEVLTIDNGDGDSSNNGSDYIKSEQPLREQDRFLPIANIAKVMKRAIPESGKVRSGSFYNILDAEIFCCSFKTAANCVNFRFIDCKRC